MGGVIVVIAIGAFLRLFYERKKTKEESDRPSVSHNQISCDEIEEIGGRVAEKEVGEIPGRVRDSEIGFIDPEIPGRVRDSEIELIDPEVPGGRLSEKGVVQSGSRDTESGTCQ